MEKQLDIRPSPLAGRWYPADPGKLVDTVDSYTDNAQPPEIEGKILALISPHAGHLYSGPVSGYAFKTIRELEHVLVIIISPFH